MQLLKCQFTLCYGKCIHLLQITFKIPSDPKEVVFTGSVKIDIDCERKTDTITLHANNLIINTSLITLQPKLRYGKTLRPLESDIDLERNLIRLKFGEKILKGKSYLIDIPQYTGNLVKPKPRGFFKDEEEDNR